MDDLGVEPTDFQRRVLAVPEEFDLALCGGRGGGKSVALALLILRHCELHGRSARCLYIRRTHQSVEDFAALTRDIFTQAYGARAKYNGTSGSWKLPGGGYVELSQLSEDAHYAKFQGRSFSMVLVDEATQHPSPRLIDLLRSNLRASARVPTRFVIAANPDGPGHSWVRHRYVTRAEPWKPFVEEVSGRTFVCCPSLYSDNPHLNQSEYEAQLRAACAGDAELYRGWVEGDWSIAKGAFFAGVLSEKRSAFGGWTPTEWKEATTYQNIPHHALIRLPPLEADLFLAHDFGVSAPSVTFVCAWSPGFEGPDGRLYPRDSLLLLDELSTNVPDDYTAGLGYTVPHLAEEIVELSKRWGVKRAGGVADDACFSRGGHAAGSIAEEFRRYGVYFQPARKAQRIPGWERMRILLQNAGKPDVPGLYVSRQCVGFWATVPTLPRDPRRADDVDSRGPDHWADAARYALARGAGPSFRVMPLHEFLGGRRG